MTKVGFTLNGRPIAADAEPRQHLADFLREEMLLTGTHLGCEHGVCGACTVLIDGAPARSCIAFPVALDGASVTTIEGLDDDPVIGRLREAFSLDHGLQCGFCTTGMLVMARDIVLRRPGADIETIRHELAGNLCRCTGYIGIIRAIKRVADERLGEAAVATRGASVAPLRHRSPLHLPVNPRRVSTQTATQSVASAPMKPARPLADPLRNPVTLNQGFDVPAPRAEVWAFFQDPARVVACLPGARLTAPSDGTWLKAEMVVKLGPIQAAFTGSATLSADVARWSGTIEGGGRDSRSSTRVQARLIYRLHEIEETVATRVEVEVAYALQGPLAQMSRGALARDLAGRMTQRFAQSLSATLAGATPAAQAAPLNAGSLAFAIMKDWLRRLFRQK